MKHSRAGFGTYLARTLFGLYAWVVFILCALFVLLAVLLVPGEKRRHKLAASGTRAIFILAGIPAEIHGLDNVPEGNAVVVANHASYVDGMLLKAYLPYRFSFVIKGEMRDIPVAHFLLRRSGSKFVERFESAGSARDARQIVKAAQSGDSLAFFPEGTFRKEPGVGRFRAGAFVSAIRGDTPIVPIAISRTRELLPAGRLWPWPVTPRFDVLPPITPDDPAFDDHRVLADKARQQILAALEEPDLQEE